MMKGMMKGMMMMKGGGFGGKGGGKGKGGRYGGSAKKLFVGGMQKTEDGNTVPDEFAVRDFFTSNFGAVSDVKMIRDDEGRAKGYCFVTFENMEDARKALANHAENIIDGQWVDVKVSDGEKPKPGDWICHNCGDLVFASRTECKSCGTAKPAGAGIPRAAPY
uniref:RRM domain-containing protein n=1 Tax=Zooxanthella nutricula TaxID=1333877 RepID=A0A7S2JMX8_9DINO